MKCSTKKAGVASTAFGDSGIQSNVIGNNLAVAMLVDFRIQCVAKCRWEGLYSVLIRKPLGLLAPAATFDFFGYSFMEIKRGAEISLAPLFMLSKSKRNTYAMQAACT